LASLKKLLEVVVLLGLAHSAELAAGTYESKNTSTTAGPIMEEVFLDLLTRLVTVFYQMLKLWQYLCNN
jgi:hypothetical protein